MKSTEQLRADYASAIVDRMDLDSLIEYAYDRIIEELQGYTDEQLRAEVREYDEELLGE